MLKKILSVSNQTYLQIVEHNKRFLIVSRFVEYQLQTFATTNHAVLRAESETLDVTQVDQFREIVERAFHVIVAAVDYVLISPQESIICPSPVGTCKSSF